jgi:glycosyltransferase involved in cell wall biosynthesis
MTEEKKPLLSILMPTIPDREASFGALWAEVDRQRQGDVAVEVLVDESKKFLDGGLSIGGKRDALVQRATGKYVCFLDDDDWIFPNYKQVLLTACAGDKDAYSFNQLYICKDFTSVIQMSHNNTENEQVRPHGITKRTIWHTCAIRAEIAKSERFTNINYDEDWRWLKLIIPKIKTSEHLDILLHQYNDVPKTSEATKIINQGHE